MWPQSEMVARVLVQERERRIQQSARLRLIQDEAEHGSMKDPFRSAGLVLALALLAAAGRLILV